MSKKHAIFIGCAMIMVGIQIHNASKWAENRKRIDNLLEAVEHLQVILDIDFQNIVDDKFEEIVDNYNDFNY